MMTTADHDLRAGPGPVVASADACDLDDRQVAPAPLWRRLLSLVLVVLLALPSPAALAALAIPQVPMLGSAATPAVPNLMVLLDNSSSMLMEVMPGQDNSQPWGVGDQGYYDLAGLYSHLCNSHYFNNGNPSTSWADADANAYPLPPAPVDPSNTVTYPPLSQPSFTAAPVDGFAAYLANPSNPSARGWKPSYSSYGLNGTNWRESPQPVVAYDPAATTDLSGKRPVSLIMTPRGYGSMPVPAGEFIWYPTRAGDLPSFFDCVYAKFTVSEQGDVSSAEAPGFAQGQWIFRKMNASMAVAPSYARWYSYYRSRMNTMKSALGNTFASTLTGGLRTGLLTTTTTPITASNIARPCPTCTDSAYENHYNPVGSYAFMPPATLDATGRAALLAKIYGQVVPQGSFTNLQTALSRAGQYYAGLGGTYAGSTWTYGMLDSSGKPDPVQSSCQRNYSLLVTDGLYSDAGNGLGLAGSLAKKSFDTPPGQGSFSQSGGSDGRNGQWARPFPDPQAYKPFDDTNRVAVTDCWLGYNSPVGFAYPEIVSNNQGIQSGSVSGSYEAYTLNQDGTETTLSSPLLVPRDATHVVNPYQFWNGIAREYYVGASETNNEGTVAVPRYGSEYARLTITSTLAPGTTACPGGVCNVLFNAQTTGITGGTTNCPTGEQAGSCTVIGGGTTEYAGEGGCQLVPWVETGTNWPQNTTIRQVGTNYFYRNDWPSPNLTCAGTRIDLRFVCSQAPVASDLSTYFWFRVPGFTHDASGAPIKYTWSRSSGRDTTPTTNSAQGITSSLADIAMYYYDTDIRPSMPNNLPVPAAGASPLSDTNRFQHMTTYTMGLGVSGYLKYAPDYATNPASDSDWASLVAGTKVWPDWQAPARNSGANDARVDDLWHAAVNGRGRYYAANNVSDVVQGLMNMVSSVVSVPVYGGAAAADRVQHQANGASFTNFFTAYWPTLWVGDLLVQAATIDASTSTPITTTGTAVSASASLRNRIQYDKSSGLWCDDRNMLVMNGSSAYDLLWDTPVKSGNRCVAGARGTQLPASSGSIDLKTALDTTTSDKGYLGSSAGDLVNWLRGSRAKEISAPMQAGQIFRYRVDNNANFMPLGDIVGGQPVYVGAPVFNYTDNGYGTFKSANASRAPRIYLAANDGFVHAFDPSTSSGVAEQWAMMPSSVVPEVYQVASPAYATNHKFILDGAPVAADVYDSGAGKWRSILVGGSRGGGALSGTSGFYAIDITDPSAAKPTPLWEFRRNPSDAACSGQTDVSNPAAGVYEACQLGFAYSTPVITKLTTGQWVVIVASGYNNRDGKGHLYILDAVTGAQVARLDNNWNGQDSGSAPESGLAQVNVWIGNSTVDNTALLAYGGDLNGKVWRYDLRTPASAETMRPTLLARLTDGDGVAQPVTTLPEMYFSPTNMPLVSLGTGQLFSDADRITTQVQSVYGLIDTYPQGNTLPGTLARSDLVGLQVSDATVNANTNTASVKGYVLDLPGVVTGGTSSERLLVNPVVIGSNLVLVSNAPSNDPCVAGGSSWIYVLNVQTGLPAAGAGQSARTALPISAVGTTVYVVGATPVVQVTGANDSFSSSLTATIQPFVGRRTAWREMR